jgi:lipopolysaccharide biosynthesis glycosyltransferase
MGSDSNYIMPTSVAIASLLSNSTSREVIYVHMFDFGLNRRDREILRSLADIKPFNIDFIHFAQDRVRDLKVCKSWPYGIFAKYFIPLESKKYNIAKAIWLDSDTVVNGNIRELYDINLRDNYIAGSPQIISTLLAIPLVQECESPIFNAGVLLFNCKKMNEDGMLEKLLAATIKLQDKVIGIDEEAFHKVIGNNSIILPFKYNWRESLCMFQIFLKVFRDVTNDERLPVVTRMFKLMQIKMDEYGKSSSDGIDTLIQHYCFTKPWKLGQGSEYSYLWYRYLKLTPFYDFRQCMIGGINNDIWKALKICLWTTSSIYKLGLKLFLA